MFTGAKLYSFQRLLSVVWLAALAENRHKKRYFLLDILQTADNNLKYVLPACSLQILYNLRK